MRKVTKRTSGHNCNYSIGKYPERWTPFSDYTHNQINELVSDYDKRTTFRY